MYGNWLVLLILLLGVTTVSGGGWQLIWRDEFSGSALNLTNWKIETGPSGRNHELHYRSADEVYLQNGSMVLRSRKRSMGGMDYTSAEVTTRGHWAAKYGRWEVRAKIPYSNGIWPAAWMMPSSGVCWPTGGEIDIMEVLGENTKKLYTTYHWGPNCSKNLQDGVANTTTEGLHLAFHVYAIEWDSNGIRWFLDGKQLHNFAAGKNGLQLPSGPMAWILNTAIGGDWPVPPDATTVWPQYYVIDYVRVYQWNSSISTTAPTTQAPTTQKPTTAAPTTQKPTTAAPTTQKPTTAAPSNAPTSVSAVATATDKAILSWAPPLSGVVSQYRVGRDGFDSSGYGAWSDVFPSTARSQTFLYLVANTDYNLFVEAILTDGTTGQRASVRVHTPSSNPTTSAPTTQKPTTTVPTTQKPTTATPTTQKPTTQVPTTVAQTTQKPTTAASSTAPTSVSAVATASDKATLSWAPPHSGVVSQYRVGRDGFDSSGSGAWSNVFPSTARSQTFLYLIANTDYNLFVEAIFADGTTSQRVTVRVHTLLRNSVAVGSQFHCMWAGSTGYGDTSNTTRAAVLDKLVSAGISSVRIDVGWDGLQPTADTIPNTNDWYVKLLDSCVALARARGLTVLLTIARCPKWARPAAYASTERVLPADPNSIYNVSAWMASRYAGKVQAIEIWNEPNLVSFVSEVNPQKYVSVLGAASRGIKAANPAMKVVFAGTDRVAVQPGGSAVDDFYSLAYQAGAKGKFDIMSVHTYQGASNLPPDAPDIGTWRILHLPALFQLMKTYGDDALPVWITEFGWSVHNNTSDMPSWGLGVTEQQQANFTVHALDIFAQWPQLKVAYIYTERQKSGTGIHEDGFGLLRRDLSARPVLAALAARAVARSTTNDSSTSSHNALTGWAITLIVIGAAALTALVVLAVAVVIVLRRRHPHLQHPFVAMEPVQ